MRAALCAALLDGTNEEIEAAKAKLTRAKRDAARKKALNAAKRIQAGAEAAAESSSGPGSAPASAPSSRGSSRSSDGTAPCVPRHVKTSLTHSTPLALREHSLSNSSADSCRGALKPLEPRVEKLPDAHFASEGPTEVTGKARVISQGRRRGFTGRPALRSPRDNGLKTIGSDAKRLAATRAAVRDLDPPVTELVMGLGDSDELVAKQAQTNASITRARVLHIGDEDPLLEMVGSFVVGVQSSQPPQGAQVGVELSAKEVIRDTGTSWNPDTSFVHKHGAPSAFMPSNPSDTNVRLQSLQHFQHDTRKHVLVSARESTKLPPNEAKASEIRAAARALSGAPKSSNDGLGLSTKTKMGAGPRRGSSWSGGGRQQARAAANGIAGREQTVPASGFRGTKKRFPAAGCTGGAGVGLAGRCLEVERAGLELRNRSS